MSTPLLQEIQQTFYRLHRRAATEEELSGLAEFWNSILSEEESYQPATILVFDGDNAGQAAARLTVQRLLPRRDWTWQDDLGFARKAMTTFPLELRPYYRGQYREFLKRRQRQEEGLSVAGGDILALAQTLTILTKKGRQWWGLCPFHTEHTPSFSVAPEKGFWFCHGCQQGGGYRALQKAIKGG